MSVVHAREQHPIDAILRTYLVHKYVTDSKPLESLKIWGSRSSNLNLFLKIKVLVGEGAIDPLGPWCQRPCDYIVFMNNALRAEGANNIRSHNIRH